MASIIRICRVLDLIAGLDRFVPEAGPRPMDLVKLKGKLRRRAPSGRQTRSTDEPWTWKA